MTLDINQLAANIKTEKTILFFGAGACIPSHAPNSKQLAEHLSTIFKIPLDDFTLSELASLVEQKSSRNELIQEIRKVICKLKPTGGLLNLPLYEWRSLFTTNYDSLIEESYNRKGQSLLVYSSNFDFTIHDKPNAIKLFKLHGTIEKDISDGHNSRIIITDSDYDHTEEYRDQLYDRLKSDLAGSHLIIIGHSLADPDIKSVVERTAKIRANSGGGGQLSLLLYQQDHNRAQLFEKRGFTVCFGGIDEFFEALAKRMPDTRTVFKSTDNPLDSYPVLTPITIDVSHASNKEPNASAIFNGWPASYADIEAGLTFERTVVLEIERLLASSSIICAALLGASGVGKTTAARQIIQRLQHNGLLCWEHKIDHPFAVHEWISVARTLETRKISAVLFIDEAHTHLHLINELLDVLAAENLQQLRLVLVSTRNLWYPRIKTPAFFKLGKEFQLIKLDSNEVDSLLNLVDVNPYIRPLIEDTFSGFSRYERRRRLLDRCEADMFVCLKNIFASEKFDDIILREYASLEINYQEIYRLVAAMESAGIRVHRQLVIRLLGIPGETIRVVLSHLTDIIHEYTIDENEGIYGWKGRHSVIVNIVTSYKFSDVTQIVDLFHKVIDCISPTYEIEIRTIRELCNVDAGIQRIPDKQIQNTLLRKMMSVAPGERVPRHRLIRNLIEMGEFDKAETEMRIFDKDFGADGPVVRYKIMLLTARAVKTSGILKEDRIVILRTAQEVALSSIAKYQYNKHILTSYCDVGVEFYTLTGDYAIFNHAISEMKLAEERIGDPDISRRIARYEYLMAGKNIDPLS